MTANPLFLMIWSATFLRVVLIVSVAVLAVYIFFLQGRFLFIRGEIYRVMRRDDPDRCTLYHDDVLDRLKFETRRLRTLKILWILILIVSAILYITFR